MFLLHIHLFFNRYKDTTFYSKLNTWRQHNSWKYANEIGKKAQMCFLSPSSWASLWLSSVGMSRSSSRSHLLPTSITCALSHEYVFICVALRAKLHIFRQNSTLTARWNFLNTHIGWRSTRVSLTSPERRWRSPCLWCRTLAESPWLLCNTL